MREDTFQSYICNSNQNFTLYRLKILRIAFLPCLISVSHTMLFLQRAFVLLRSISDDNALEHSPITIQLNFPTFMPCHTENSSHSSLTFSPSLFAKSVAASGNFYSAIIAKTPKGILIVDKIDFFSS